MCSVGDENSEDPTQNYMQPAEKIDLSTLVCNKCKEGSPIIVLRSTDAYCKTCFLNGTVHKFKSLLGKHKLIRHKDKVLVAYQAGQPSSALLQFLRSGLDLRTAKQLTFEPTVLVVEDYTYLEISERKKLLEDVNKHLNSFGFEKYFVSFTDYAFSKSVENLLSSDWSNINITDQNVNEIFTKKLNQTNKKDILQTLKRNLLLKCAEKLDCKFVFTPELSVDIASQLLTNISLGKGSHISLDTGFCDSFRNENITIVRPLRLFEIKELVMYNQLNNIEPVCIPEQEQNIYSSVQNLMQNFVTNLQVNYPATISTIVKTGDKIGMEKSLNGLKCNFCKAPLQKKSDHLSSEESTRFSHSISTITSKGNNLDPVQQFDILNNVKSQENTQYCFACEKSSVYLKQTEK